MHVCLNMCGYERRTSATICLLVSNIDVWSVTGYLSVFMSMNVSHTHVLVMCTVIATERLCVCRDQAEVKTLLAFEFSAVTPLPITLSSLTACAYVCANVCSHSPRGAMMGADACSFTLGR